MYPASGEDYNGGLNTANNLTMRAECLIIADF